MRNLREATQRTKRMCAVLLDTIGRELIIRREYTLDDEVMLLDVLPIAWLPTQSCSETQAEAGHRAREIYGVLRDTLGPQGCPVHTEGLDIKAGQEVVVTTDSQAVASATLLPIAYPHFALMCQVSPSRVCQTFRRHALDRM